MGSKQGNCLQFSQRVSLAFCIFNLFAPELKSHFSNFGTILTKRKIYQNLLAKISFFSILGDKEVIGIVLNA